MSFTDKHIVETYADMFEGLSALNKLELIDRLSKSLKAEIKSKEEIFYSSFGAFAPEKSAEEIIEDIRSSRKFRSKEIEF